MIVDMKEVTVFVSADSRDAALEELRELGILHVENIQPPESRQVSELEEEIRQANSALHILSDYEEKAQTAGSGFNVEGAELVEKVLELQKEKLDLQDQLDQKRELLKWYDTWGKIDSDDLQTLERRGVYVRLYKAGKSYYEELPEDLPVYKINESASRVYLALVTEDQDQSLDLKEEKPPEEEFKVVEAEYEQTRERIAAIKSELIKLSNSIETIESYKKELEEDLEFARVRSGMGAETEISYLRGFCPVDEIDSLKEAAARGGWGYLIKDPADPREVPTMLSNSLFSRLVDPIYRFMGTLPGYDEFDVSTAFLAFFAVFVALIVGDAAYGLIYLGLTAFAHKKFSDNVPGETFTLFYILSISTIIWGLLTGTIFGVEQLQEVPVLRSIIVEPIRTFADNDSLLMFITFAIGCTQLMLGHLMQLLKALFKPQALAEAGWVVIVGSMLFVADELVLGGEMVGEYVSYGQLGVAIGGGAILVLLFENFKPGEFWSGIAFTLGNLPMDIISAFADIVSYIRLFAVGLATVVIMESFNEIAMEAAGGVDNIIAAVIIGAVILVLGHGLNLILCLMSIVVHGIRLNMLEFSNHVGMQWTGSRYNPFGGKRDLGHG